MAKDKESFISTLQKVFSTRSSLVNIGGNKIKVVDLNQKQLNNIPNNFQFYDYERYGRLYSTVPQSLYNQAAAFNYQLAKIELYKSYEDMDRDSILASVMDIYSDECLGESTIIPLLDGRKLTIKELYDLQLKDFWVYSLDVNLDKFLPNKCQYVKYNGKKKMYRLTLEDGTQIEASENHLWVTPEQKLVYTSDLKLYDSIKAFEIKSSNSQNNNLINSNNHRIINIEYIGEQDAYDLVNVGESHIYAIETKDGSKLFCHNSSLRNEYGDILRIHSKNGNVQEVLSNLFYDVMNIEFNLWTWIRNLCKYGDFYLKLNIVENHGVVNIQPLSPYSVVRLEDIYNPNADIVFMYDPTFGIDNSMYGAKVQKFDEYEIAHFRLIADSNFLPYGRSIIEPARKTWEQLCLSGDSEVWTPKGYTDIKDLIPGDDIYSFDPNTNQIISTKVKYQKQTGFKTLYEIRTSHRLIKATEDHPMMISDGTFKEVKNLTLDDNLIIIDSIESDNSKIEYPNLILPDLLYANFNDTALIDIQSKYKNLCEIDNTIQKRLTGNYIKFKYNMTYKEYMSKYNINKYQSSLLNRNARIPYNNAIAICNKFNIDINQLNVYTKSSKYQYLDEQLLKNNFKMFVRFFGFMLGDGWLDGNRVSFSIGERRDKSQKYIDFIQLLGLSCKENIKDVETKNDFSINSLYFKKLLISLGFNSGTKNKTIPNWIFNLPTEYQTELLLGFADADGCDVSLNRWSVGGINKTLITQLHHIAQRNGMSVTNITTHTPTTSYVEWGDRKTPLNNCYGFCFQMKETHLTKTFEGRKIEKIKSIIKLTDEPVYDIQVNHDLHNFIVNGCVSSNCMMEDAMMINRIMRAPSKRVFKIDIGNIPPNEVDNFMEKTISKLKKVPYVDQNTGDYNLKFNLQNMLEDFYVPVRGGNSGTTIESLEGIEFNGIEDIDYLRKRMFAALKVPPAFLGYDKDLEGKATLAAEDLRFARTIERVQKLVESELYKIAIIHLFVQGFRSEDLVDFKLTLTPASTIYQREKIDIWKSKMELLRDMKELKMLPKSWMYEHVMEVDEDEWKEMQDDIVTDAKFEYRLGQISEQGQDPKDVAEKGKENTEQGEGENEWDMGNMDKQEEDKEKEYSSSDKDKEQYEPFNDIHGDKVNNDYKLDTKLTHSYHGGSPLSMESKIEDTNRLIEKLDKKLQTKKRKKNIVQRNNIL